MFKSLKELVEIRLSNLVVIDDFFDHDIYFLKVDKKFSLAAMSFLKNDPDTRLSLLEQVIGIESGFLPWPINRHENYSLEVIYQLRSIRLPYRVSICSEVNRKDPVMISASNIFLGAKWCEEEIRKRFGITFEEEEKKMPLSRGNYGP